MQRIFVAIEINEQIRTIARRQIDSLEAHADKTRVSWVKPQNIHLTLRFFGDVTDDELSAVNEAVAACAGQTEEFCFQVTGTGVFPNMRKPSVLWLGIRDTDGNLNQLKENLDQNFHALGYPIEKRKFHPHLTIARLRQPRSAIQIAKAHLDQTFDSSDVIVDRLVIYQSQLESTGAVYSERFSAELQSRKES
ncbi:MAG: RNA 2',3'-cyclic phosphodiesterase [Pyrinomonadaceae bacterium]|nr:RNA 2',3'-cyclic phosphodiesterase [Pyrinomonadaceae bacterium]